VNPEAPTPRGRLTAAEAALSGVCATLAIVIAIGYVWGRVGGISPTAMLAVASACLIAAIAALTRATRVDADSTSLIGAAAVTLVTTAGLAYCASPALLPPGRGPDLSYHLMLVDFIERNWRLPDDSHVAAMVEMAHYTPGLHLLAALSGAWTGTIGFYTIYPVVAITVAIKFGLVFLIGARMLSGHAARLPLALVAALLCLSATEYALGSFLHDSFLAQVAAEMFAVGMLWAALAWDGRPSALVAGLFAVMGTGTLLTWPMSVGPPIVAFTAAALTHDSLDVRGRARYLAIALTPIVAFAIVHAAGRPGWLTIAETTGGGLSATPARLGWLLVVTGIGGAILATRRRSSRVPLLLMLSVVALAITLDFGATSRGASAASRTIYLLVYPLAVLATLPFALFLDRTRRSEGARAAIGWAMAFAVAIVVGASLRGFSMPTPIVSADLEIAGRWAREHVDAACIDYLVPNRETMHWLHLAVLGNSRSTLRTLDPATFDPKAAPVRWLEPAGLPYAIAHVRTLPRDVLERVDVLEEFGEAAVVSRRGPSSCVDAQRLAGVAGPMR
jgi:hypothetical protein